MSALKLGDNYNQPCPHAVAAINFFVSQIKVGDLKYC